MSSHGCATPTCPSFASPKYQVLNRTACLTTVAGKQSPCFGYYSQKRDLLMLHRAPKPLLLKPTCAVRAGEEEIQLNRRLRAGEDRAAEKARRWRERRGSKLGQSGLRFGISVGEDEGKEQEGIEHSEESGGLVVDRGGSEREEGGVSVVFPPSSTEKKKTVLPTRERDSAPPPS
jgi:hypothetical protein